MRLQYGHTQHLIITLFLGVIFLVSLLFRHYIASTLQFSDDTITLISSGYSIFFHLIAMIAVTNLVSWIFHQIRFYARNGHVLLRKLIPLLRFFALSITWIAGTILLLDSLGVNTHAILTGAGIGGVIFALAGKDIISNLVGSLSIILGNLFEIDDMIILQDRGLHIEGMVREITLNYTRIMSYEGVTSFIPNRMITERTIENISRRKFFLSTFRIPFKRQTENPTFVINTLHSIEQYMNDLQPIDRKIEYIDINANDYIYEISLTLPEENRQVEADFRDFLTRFIFRGEQGERHLDSPENLQK